MNRPAFERALDFAARQCRQVIEQRPGYHPMYTALGRWGQEGELWTHWCEGFNPGIFWLLAKHTGEAYWRRHAEEYSRRLAPRRYDRKVHDLGFIFFSTYLRWFRLTNDPALRDVLIDAGRTLALRRQMGGYLASFIGPESLFIDIMMNVGIILWAANAIGPSAIGSDALRAIALEHCRTTERYLVRPDGGTAHEGVFDRVHVSIDHVETVERGLAQRGGALAEAERAHANLNAYRRSERVRVRVPDVVHDPPEHLVARDRRLVAGGEVVVARITVAVENWRAEMVGPLLEVRGRLAGAVVPLHVAAGHAPDPVVLGAVRRIRRPAGRGV